MRLNKNEGGRLKCFIGAILFSVLLIEIIARLTIFSGLSPLAWTPNIPNLNLVMTSDEFSIKIVTNDQGFRMLEHIDTEREKHNTRIVTVGDSYTFGYGVNNDETYPFQLSKLLNQETDHFQVINLGAPGIDYSGYLRVLHNSSRPFHPEYIILGTLPGQDCPLSANLPNDLHFSNGDVSGIIKEAVKSSYNPWGVLSVKRKIAHSSFIGSRLLVLLDQQRIKKSGMPPESISKMLNPLTSWVIQRGILDSQFPQESQKRFDRLNKLGWIEKGKKENINPWLIYNAVTSPKSIADAAFLNADSRQKMLANWKVCQGILAEINAISKDMGSKLIIVSIPIAWQVDPKTIRFRNDVLGLEISDDMLVSNTANKLVADFCLKNNILHFDFLESFRTKYQHGNTDLFYEQDAHMTPQGNALLAELMYEKIKPIISPKT
jgi:lysophospholipase L1-like esterase